MHRATEHQVYTLNYYRPQRSCGQGNIFTPVCHSVHRGGVLSPGGVLSLGGGLYLVPGEGCT